MSGKDARKTKFGGTAMCNGIFGGNGNNCCWWIIILLVLFFCCGNGCGNSYGNGCGNDNCGCC